MKSDKNMTSEKAVIEEVKKLISNNDLEDAIEILVSKFPYCKHDLLVIKAQHDRIRKDHHRGIIKYDRYTRQLNKLSERLLIFIDSRIKDTSRFQRFVNQYRRKHKKKRGRILLFLLFLFSIGRDNIKIVIVGFFAIVFSFLGIRAIYLNGNQIMSVIMNGNWVNEVDLDVSRWECDPTGYWDMSGTLKNNSKIVRLFGEPIDPSNVSQPGISISTNFGYNGFNLEFPEDEINTLLEKHVPSFEGGSDKVYEFLSANALLKLKDLNTDKAIPISKNNDSLRPTFSKFQQGSGLAVMFYEYVPPGVYNLVLFVEHDVYKVEYEIGQIEFANIN